VPLRSSGVLIGVVYVDDRTERGLFTENDLKFLEAFANHAGLALENAQIRGELERDNQRLQVAAETRVQFANMIGSSPAMLKVFDLIERVAETKLPVLILGESGTGKELVAKAIHFNGPLKRKPMLTENCAAIPEALLESELFGHVKGAFTGADRDRPGLFEQADGGSLFLDEVGDMAAAMQARLLRVLQEGELRRVGGNRTLKVDVRVVAATHRDLQVEVDAGRFREDLLYRLQVLVIDLPPLRARHGDIPLLIDHMMPKIAASRGRPAPRIRSAVMDLLERYSWPGNIRQLESTLQRLALLAGDRPITPDVIESDHTLSQMLIEGAGQESTIAPRRDEKARIEAALKSAGGNRVRAARLLGMSRATIFRRIKAYDL
jgi:Nif-specific regulatory protein